MEHLPDGEVLNRRYKILRFLSSGGFGNTYEAEDLDEGSHIAIKELFLSGICKRGDNYRDVTIAVVANIQLFNKQKEKFRKEANRLRSIHHPNVVRVRDEFEANGTAYYVMDFVRGKSLADMLREGLLNEKKSVQYIKQVLSALEAVHNAGILHLDIKPGNVMVDDNNSVVLIDFGASKQLEMVEGKSLSLSTGIAFTPGFAAIEQMMGNNEIIGKYTDIYSIGATLYKLITGVTPPNPNEILIEGLPEISASPQVQSAIKSAMQVKYTERPQSVAELRAILNGDAIATEPLQPQIASRQQEQDDKTIVDTDNISNKAPSSPDEDKTNVAEENKPNVRLTDTSSESETKPDTESESSSKGCLTSVLVTLGLIFLGVLIYYGVGGKFGSCSNDTSADSSAYNYIEDAPAAPAVEEAPAAFPDKAVDLGLSVLWADRNIGASSPSDYGGYYAWGETTTKSNYTWDTYQYFHDQDGNGTPYDSNLNTQANELANLGSNISGTRYDVARQKWGGGWKMPTQAQWQELIDNCTWTWTTQGGHSGYKVTSKKNGNSIFLPAAGYRNGTSSLYVGSHGYCWSSTLYESDTNNAWGLSFSGDLHVVYGNYRYYGHPVRPICNK